MPYKYNQNRRHHIPKSSSQNRDWAAYNKALKQRGDITVWLSVDAIEAWYETERVYDGTGAPQLYTNMAILTAHKIRQIFKLPLRQCEGFINSLFKLLKVDLNCPSFSALSKRLKKLNLTRPFYTKAHSEHNSIKAIAIDSSGLKCYGQDEWCEENYPSNLKKDWKKLHITVDQFNIIHTSELTDRLTQDNSVVNQLIKPIHEKVKQVTGDSAYDTDTTYNSLAEHFPSADIVISPQKDARVHKGNEFFRNRNILEIEFYGRMGWQKRRNYGKRNNSELAIQRYKRILGNRLHSREFERQKQETLIGCSILNKMMCINLAEIRPVS